MEAGFVAYYRVSTAQQGSSGLGLSAQRSAVEAYLAGGHGRLGGEFTDIESGKNADRPELLKAIELCTLTGFRLLIAKLDRLSRDVHFLSGLEKQGIDFVACDMPTANRFTVHIMAAVAQQEREAISARTKAALQSIRQRIAADGHHVSRSGRSIARLGNPNPLGRVDHAAGTAAVMAKAQKFAGRVAPTIAALRSGGATLQGVADRLNEMSVKTARGASWTPTAVKRIVDRQKVAPMQAGEGS